MKKRRPPPRVLRFLQPCPDCNAEVDGAELHHAPTCPIGNGVEDACDDDRAWFLAHPQEWTRTRPITRAEVETMRHLDPAGAATNPDHVHVVNQPWGRARTFCNGTHLSALVLDPDEWAS